MPLPATCTALGGVLLIGMALVVSQPRPSARGLGRLIAVADLVQSFPIDRSQPVPELWRERLGPEAPVLWQQSRGLWWQLWSHHEEGEPFLVINAADRTRRPRATQSLRVDDLVVVAPGALPAQELQRSLQTSHPPLQGLEGLCLARLQREQAVYWSPQGLSGVLGPLTPLFQHWQQGCLSLSLSRDRLAWTGEASAVAGVLGTAPAPLTDAEPGFNQATLPPGTLLVMRGSRLDLLLGSLMRRSLLRDSLSEHYGLDPESLARLGASPFALQLRRLPRGSFRLGLSLEIDVSGDRASWRRTLERMAEGIRRQGLRPEGTITGPAQGAGAAPAGERWQRPDGATVGGWRWLDSPRGASATRGPSRLLLFLGPPPPPLEIPWRTGRHSEPSTQLEVLMDPRQLAAEQVLPSALPPLLHAAQTLKLVAGGANDGVRAGTISPLWGELRLSR